MSERPTARPLAGRQRGNSTEATAAAEDRQGSQRSRQLDGSGGGGSGGVGETTDTQRGRPAHRKLCRRYERRQAGCLNGGRCFVIELHKGLRRPGCR